MSLIKRYKDLIAGSDAGYCELFFYELILGVLGCLPTVLGALARSLIYGASFKYFSMQTFVGRNVSIRCPQNIQTAPGVIIDDYAQLIANSENKPSLIIGAGTVIKSNALLYAGPPCGVIVIGENSDVGQGSILYGNGGLRIGSKVMISGQCFIVASSHHFDQPGVPMKDQGFSAKGIVIRDNVWIGAGAKILDGVEIGEGCVVGANAVVNKDVPPNTIVAGVPAQQIGTLPH